MKSLRKAHQICLALFNSSYIVTDIKRALQLLFYRIICYWHINRDKARVSFQYYLVRVSSTSHTGKLLQILA